MLLATDIGNTTLQIGVFNDRRLGPTWRLATDHSRLADEYGILVASLLRSEGIDIAKIDGAIISSVVPALVPVFQEVTRRFLKVEPILVSDHMLKPLKIGIEHADELGADRIADATPRCGSSVVNGYAATRGRAALNCRSSDDFPAFGSPTSPMSATSCNSSRSRACSPASPFCDARGAWFTELLKCAFPYPPAPPQAATICCPCVPRSASRSPPSSARHTTVPTGTSSTSGAPAFPRRLPGAPAPPACARNCRCRRYRRSVFNCPSATTITSPPRPPRPPSGPPRGTNFSRRNDTAPRPPSPAIASISTVSIMPPVYESSAIQAFQAPHGTTTTAMWIAPRTP